ncbi:hypothetical protein FF38_02356 [Lucilia cuprina]|uniref:Uncharacterized protein n=1 Tax=Lucilia cuprina TaxID=7375 RepID=A0A0L0CDH1_LUCCU|nr:hypothetical protein FF38_02356 [Lucilia cuprina]
MFYSRHGNEGSMFSRIFVLTFDILCRNALPKHLPSLPTSGWLFLTTVTPFSDSLPISLRISYTDDCVKPLNRRRKLNGGARREITWLRQEDYHKHISSVLLPRQQIPHRRVTMGLSIGNELTLQDECRGIRISSDRLRVLVVVPLGLNGTG